MIPIRIESVYDEHPDLSRRELHRVMRAAHRAMGVKWAIELLPEHFEPGAGNVFGYAKRTEKWLRRKERLKAAGRAEGGREDDLVFTGRLRREVLLTARFNINAYPTRVTIRMSGPVYFTLRPRGKGTVRLAREVLSMSRRHERLIGEAGERGFNAELREVRRSRRLRKVTRTS
jgi:hypothetical protein